MSLTVKRASKGAPLTSTDHDDNVRATDFHEINVEYFGARGDGSTDSEPAFSEIGDHLRTIPLDRTVVVHFPRGDYVSAFDGAIDRGVVAWGNCPSIIIEGHGSRLTNMAGKYSGGDLRGASNHTMHIGRIDFLRKPSDRATQWDWRYAEAGSTDGDATELELGNTKMGVIDAGDLIHTARPGDFTITLQTAGDASAYEVHDRIMINSQRTREGNTPPSGGIPATIGKIEFRRVRSVDAGTGVIGLDRAIAEYHDENLFDSTYFFEPMGKPRVINLTKRFVPELIQIKNLHLGDKLYSPDMADVTGNHANGGMFRTGANTVIVENVRARTLWPKMADLFRVKDSFFFYAEPDKILRTFELDNSTLTHSIGGGTALWEMKLNRSSIHNLNGQRSYFFEAIDSEIGFGDTEATSYASSFFRGVNQRTGGRIIRSKLWAGPNAHVRFGYTINGKKAGLRIGHYQAEYPAVTITAGTPTPSFTFSGNIPKIGREMFWPGRKFLWKKEAGGYTTVKILSLDATTPPVTNDDGQDMTVLVETSHALAASDYYAMDWLTYDFEQNQILTEPNNGLKHISGISYAHDDGVRYTVRFHPDAYTEFVPDTSFQASIVEKLVVNVDKPYTGADATAEFQFQPQTAPLSGTAANSGATISVNLKVAGRREYGLGYVIGNQTDDTATGIPTGVFHPRLLWVITALSERQAGTDDKSVMPELSCEVVLRRCPDLP